MAEPLYDLIHIPTIEGAWLASSSGVPHFFPDGEERCMCLEQDRAGATEPEGGIRDWDRSAACASRLGVEHTRLDREAEEARGAEEEPRQVADLSRARRFGAAAAIESNRFRRVLLLAAAREERLCFRRAGKPSSFGKVRP